MKRCRNRIAAIGLVVMLPWVATEANEPAQPDQISGFALPAFQSGYPSAQFEYGVKDAQRLALELFPAVADQVAHAVVREQVALPSGAYRGLNIEFALAPRVERQSICEQPRIFITMLYNKTEHFGSEQLRLVIRKGAIADHDFDAVSRTGRYRSLSDAPKSPAAALAACRKLADDMSEWKDATSADDFVRQRWRQNMFFSALTTLPGNKFKCVGIDGKRCDETRDELTSYFRTTPPDHSTSQFVPGEGEVNIFSGREPGHGVNRSYEVTLWLEQGKPRTIVIHFEELPQLLP